MPAQLVELDTSWLTTLAQLVPLDVLLVNLPPNVPNVPLKIF